MAAISYSIALGQTLEQVTVGTNAPSAGNGTMELRFDQTSIITDASAPGGTRPLTHGDLWTMLKILEMRLSTDGTVFHQ
jgi:hypothetical protein